MSARKGKAKAKSPSHAASHDTGHDYDDSDLFDYDEYDAAGTVARSQGSPSPGPQPPLSESQQTLLQALMFEGWKQDHKLREDWVNRSRKQWDATAKKQKAAGNTDLTVEQMTIEVKKEWKNRALCNTEGARKRRKKTWQDDNVVQSRCMSREAIDQAITDEAIVKIAFYAAQDEEWGPWTPGRKGPWFLSGEPGEEKHVILDYRRERQPRR
jgi:hypothetical protein